MRTFACTIVALLTFSASRAESQSVTAAMTSGIGRARSLIDGGEGVAARTLLDSLVAFTAPGSDDMAEALYWRASLADRTVDAERDWKRLVVDMPLAPRVPDALLRLADLEILRGRPDAARSHLARIERDFSDSPLVPRARLVIARSYFEELDLLHACEIVAGVQASGVPEGELRLQADQMKQRCASATASAVAAAAAVPASGAEPRGGKSAATEQAPPAERESGAASGSGKWSVQLAAYDTRAQADAVVKRLAKRGLTARIDGTRKPYRVRVGKYATRADAAAALARLKKQGHKGFVTEIGQ